ncbi:MAG: M55 family metallopeptidase [Oscillospiraceae bacterium]|nr:M55 family metallopeptidase [Oscillospiraceae bacterium]
MKNSVLIITDLEGISGVYTIDQIFEETEYKEACKLLIADTNAAVDGAFAAGAEKVYVVDGHGSGKNFPENALDPRAIRVGVPEMHDVIHEIGAVMQVGAHAKSGTMLGFLDHTQSSATIHNYCYNGVPCGEMEQIGIYTGYYGIPNVMLSGDRTACEEAEKSFPGIRTAAVKIADSRNHAVCLHQSEALGLIRQAACDGFRARGEIAPFRFPVPFTVEVEYNRADYCEAVIASNPAIERVDARTARQVKNTVTDFYSVLLR